MSICVYLYVYIHTHIYTHKYNVNPFSSWAQTPKTISWRVNKMNHILVLQCSELTWDSLGSKVTGLSMALCHRTQQARGSSSRRIFLYYCRMMHSQAVSVTQVNLSHFARIFFCYPSFIYLHRHIHNSNAKKRHNYPEYTIEGVLNKFFPKNWFLSNWRLYCKAFSCLGTTWYLITWVMVYAVYLGKSAHIGRLGRIPFWRARVEW